VNVNVNETEQLNLEAIRKFAQQRITCAWRVTGKREFQ
jgi:hypothetical protein